MEQTRRVADRYCIPSDELRPCVARMLEERTACNREHTAFMIATDLGHVGFEPADTERVLTQAQVATIAQIKKAVRSAIGYKRWGCTSVTMRASLSDVRQHFCVGLDACIWRGRHGGKAGGKFNDIEDRKFEAFGWHHILTLTEHVLYIKIREYEHIHGVGTGGKIIKTHDRLGFEVGCTRRNIGNALKGLASKGLIHYLVGDHTRQVRRASTIQRIIPIPEPPQAYTWKLKEFEQFRHTGRID